MEIHVAQEYGHWVWDTVNQGAAVGGHEIGGGKHDPTGIYAATWAHIARMTPAYVAGELGEHHVIIWRHVWDNLTSERQAHLAADYQALTGRAFPVPAPEETMYVPRKRILDTRLTSVWSAPSRLASLGRSRSRAWPVSRRAPRASRAS